MRIKNVSIYKPESRRKKHHPWLIAVRCNGLTRVTTGSTDYDDTRELAEQLSRIAQRVENKQSDHAELRQEIQRHRPLTKHINDYEQHLKSSGKTSKHALQMRLYVEEALEAYATVDDIVASEVQNKVALMKVSNVTKNRRMYAVRTFLAWGADDDRWPRRAADRIKLPRLTQTKTRQRRVLSLDDLTRLIHVAENGITVAGVTGSQRALMYRTLVSTGLRFGELTRLRLKHIADGGFDIPSDLTKNRKPAFVTLPKKLFEEINEFAFPIDGRAIDPDLFIFPVQKFNPDRMLKHDLEAAGIPRTTPRGVYDFHSMRHQCATLLAASGAEVKVIQSHMRHGSIKLTMDTYGHLFDRDRVRAAEVMGKIVQRVAQRTGAYMPNKNPLPRWSDGESNPDLLNAIQKSETLLELKRGEFLNKRGRRIAPGAAQRLLRRVFKRAMQRGKK